MSTDTTTDTPRPSGRGGWRPGAGRPRKNQTAIEEQEQEPERPAIGDTVWFWWLSGGGLIPRPGIVLAVGEAPGDPDHPPLTLCVFADARPMMEVVRDVPYADPPAMDSWSWPTRGV